MTKYASAVRILNEDPEIRFKFEAPSRRARHEIRKERFVRDHAIGIIIAALWIISVWAAWLISGTIATHNALQDIDAARKTAVEEYKAQIAYDEQAEHWKSGEASKEAAKNQEVEILARWMSFFKTDEAKMSFGGNVLVRWLSDQYPMDLRSVLTEPKQFEFGSENLISSERDKELAGIIWDMHEQKTLFSGLTMQHLYGEVRDGGKDYVVRNTYEKSAATDYWRWKG